jgi:hypothetical protein
MDWLTRVFAEHSVAWIVLSAVVGLLSGAVSAWITYQFKRQELLETAQLKQKELVATMLGDIEVQRQIQAGVQEKERQDRVREQIIKWANPILSAVEDLNHRLDNILDRGYVVLNKQGQFSSQWSITYDYFMSSTLYLFAQYFAWIQMLREQLSFELFQSEQTKVEFFKHMRAVGKPLADLPYAPLNNCRGEDRQVFRLQQRVIGELLILRESNSHRCMSYPDFLEKLKEPSFDHHLVPLRALLENVNPDDNCRWIRLEETRKALWDLMEYCQQVLKMPQETTRGFPAV